MAPAVGLPWPLGEEKGSCGREREGAWQQGKREAGEACCTIWKRGGAGLDDRKKGGARLGEKGSLFTPVTYYKANPKAQTLPTHPCSKIRL